MISTGAGKKILLGAVLLFILSLAVLSSAVADEGLRYVEVPTLSHDTSRSYTIIEAEVENIGYDNVFICLPDGWTVKEDILFAEGENVLTSRTEITAKYGRKEDRFSFIRNNFVFDFKFPVVRGSPITITPDCTEGGWYVRPNERLYLNVKLMPGPSEANFDPLYLEKNYNYTNIRVKRWSQEFRIYPDKEYGFVEAPYLVKRATMVEAYPGIFLNKSSLSDKPYYIEKFQEEEKETGIDLSKVPSWNNWFGESKMFHLEPKMLAETKTKYFEMPPRPTMSADEGISFIPIWLFDRRESEFIQYSYEWRRDRQIEGIDIDAYLSKKKVKSTSIGLIKVPEWYSWF